RGMAVRAPRGQPRAVHRTRLTGWLPLLRFPACAISHRRARGGLRPRGNFPYHFLFGGCANNMLRGRLAQYDVSNHVNVEDPAHVGGSVVALFAARYPGADLGPLSHAFADTRALFGGAYPGYLPCDTLYHDLRHTLDVSLAMARLVDGHDRTHPEPERLGARRAMLGVIISLLHDSGYMRRTS